MARHGWLLLVLLAAACRDKPRGVPTGPAAPSASRTRAPAPEASAAAAAPLPDASADSVSAASPAATPAAPSVLGAGKVDGAALIKRHVARLRKDASPVTVLRGKTPFELGKAICEAVMPRLSHDTPVLLKPNLCGFDGLRDPARTHGDNGLVGRTTNVEFTRGVVRCLKQRGLDKITIAEGCGISHHYWEEVIKTDGYAAMAREEHVSLVAMDDDGVYDVQGNKPGQPLRITGIGRTHVPRLLMPRILAETLDRGVFVSLPKIKAHRYAVYSMSVKGVMGTVMFSTRRPAYRQKSHMHRELNKLLEAEKAAHKAGADAGALGPMARRKAYVASLGAFSQRIADVLELETPDVVLADGAPAMGGDGFWKLYPSSELVAIGGTNPVRVDQVGAEFLGVWKNARLKRELLGFDTSPLISITAKRLGLDLDTTKIVGNGAALLQKPRPVHYFSMDRFAILSDKAPAWKPIALDAGPG